jgi:hypothetical protein
MELQSETFPLAPLVADVVKTIRSVVGGKRFTKTVKGTKKKAWKELRDLLKSADDNMHVEPAKLTVANWIDAWLAAGTPSCRKKQIRNR